LVFNGSRKWFHHQVSALEKNMQRHLGFFSAELNVEMVWQPDCHPEGLQLEELLFESALREPQLRSVLDAGAEIVIVHQPRGR
jgi:hypothetical protein